jgi:hypothetical protein
MYAHILYPDPEPIWQEQENKLRTYCENNNLQVVATVYDFGINKLIEKQQFDKMYQLIRRGKLKTDLLLFPTAGIYSLDSFELFWMQYIFSKEFGITAKTIDDKGATMHVMK